MAGELLLDTGALVSLLERSQRDHEACTEFFASWSGPMLSTEATHLLGGLSGGRRAGIDFFLVDGALLVPVALASLGRARQLIDQYTSVPMDYADATLVVLADELVDLVFTTDRRDLGVYRRRGRHRFRIVPDVRR